MKKIGKYYHYWVLIIGAVMTVLLGVYTVRASEHQAKLEANHTLEIYSARSESLLNSLFHKTDVLESIIITSNGEVPEATFTDLAKSLMQNKGIRAIQYLPDGIVKYCYPLEGNEKAVGGNIFENPKRKEDAILARDTRQIALSGPYSLTQGGLGLVARNPIFITGADGNEHFWGFSVIVLDLPEALEPLMLPELEREGYEYRLSTVIENDTVIIAQSPDYRVKNPITQDIKVPNHTWQLTVSPAKSWYSYLGLSIIFGVGFGITALCAIIVRMLEERNEQLEQFADFDALTGLVNRRKLLNYMELRCRDKKVSLALLYLDIDDFKNINDTYGHSQGDILLKETGSRMKQYIAGEDIVARVGGDEFVVILERCDTEAKCLTLVKGLKEALAQPLKLGSATLRIKASVGYALYPRETADLQELLNLADQRMYKEKKDRKEPE